MPGTNGNVVGVGDGKLTPLTVDFHEPGFASTVGAENGLVLGKGFGDEETLHVGPSDQQALNRYSYVLNNPLRYTDPTGHDNNCFPIAGEGGCTGSGAEPVYGPGGGTSTATAVGTVIVGGAVAPTMLDNAAEPQDGDYSNLQDPPDVAPGKDFSKSQKKNMIEENKRRHGGEVLSDESGIVLQKPSKSNKGVKPPDNEWQLDHKKSKDKGGTNSYSNGQVLSRKENRKKSNK